MRGYSFALLFTHFIQMNTRDLIVANFVTWFLVAVSLLLHSPVHNMPHGPDGASAPAQIVQRG